MAELVDAADSKSAVRKDVQVRFLFRALEKPVSIFTGFSILWNFFRSFVFFRASEKICRVHKKIVNRFKNH